MAATKRMIGWAVLGTLPGVALVILSVPVGPEVDLLLGLGGIFIALVGALVGALAGREDDPTDRRRVAGGAAAGAAVGALLLALHPIVGTILAVVGAFVGADRARRSRTS